MKKIIPVLIFLGFLAMTMQALLASPRAWGGKVDPSAVEIQDLAGLSKNPQPYLGKMIKVTGVVTSPFSRKCKMEGDSCCAAKTFTECGFYLVNNARKIFVCLSEMQKDQPVPSEISGARVVVYGRLSSGVSGPEISAKRIEAAGKLYTCSMHPEVISTTPGDCPKCGMKLIIKD